MFIDNYFTTSPLIDYLYNRGINRLGIAIPSTK